MPEGCGSCNFCCRALDIVNCARCRDGLDPCAQGDHAKCTEPNFKKPFLKWCEHVIKGVGCGIYADRPGVCRRFRCLWLESQDGASPDGSITWDVMPPEMRPDRCGVMFAAIDPDHPDTRIHAHVNPLRPSAWLRGDVQAWMVRMLTRGITIGLHVGDKFTALTPTTHLRPKGIKT